MIIRGRVAARRRRRWTFSAALLVGLAPAGLLACSSTPATRQAASGSSSSAIFPSDTLTDWVSYAHQISVVTVVKEQEMPLEAEVVQLQEGLVGRVVTMRVDRTLWTEPGRAAPRGGEIEVKTWGWVLHEGAKKEFLPRGDIRIGVGKRYVVPFTSNRGRWTPLTLHSVLPLDDGDRVVLEPTQHDEVGGRFADKSLADLESAIHATPQDPVAMKYRHLPPRERVQAVMREKAAGVPSTGG